MKTTRRRYSMPAKKPARAKKDRTRIIGRPIALDRDMQEMICQAIRAGNYVESAVLVAGITKKTFHEWLLRGKRGEAPFADFLNAVQKAQAEADVRDIMRIDRAGGDSWQALAWKLERRRPHLFGRQDRKPIDETAPPFEADPQFDPKRLTAGEQDEFLSMMPRFNELIAKGMPAIPTGVIDAEIVSP